MPSLNLYTGIAIAAAIIFILGGVYSYGRYDGKAHEKARWVAARNAEKTAFEEKIAAMAKDADKKAADYEALKQKWRVAMAGVRKGISNEIAKNPALRNCIANDIFLQLYGAVASPNLPAPSR